jgi:formate hydrogenlyase subunit 6/NADH:ubiquinone oxidoreductase subunit I
MFRILKERYYQGNRTFSYPEGDLPPLPERFTGKPFINNLPCPPDCDKCLDICPVSAIKRYEDSIAIDTGLSLFCRKSEKTCLGGIITFSRFHQLAVRERHDLLVTRDTKLIAPSALSEIAQKIFKNSFKLRQVSAGGCNACEADCNVLSTPAWDMGRFGISFVASPRHADGMLFTGPVTENMPRHY